MKSTYLGLLILWAITTLSGCAKLDGRVTAGGTLHSQGGLYGLLMAGAWYRPRMRSTISRPMAARLCKATKKAVKAKRVRFYSFIIVTSSAPGEHFFYAKKRLKKQALLPVFFFKRFVLPS
ncbi:hypothetical protein WCN91_05420 [Pseudoalteromonas sp. YIC-827]|uniref:Lipoprotein n=1 Tax=Pseudoalteromonas qingdaonensis TaxID=3131913 RepID=A0ABU9MU89_9GAMM